MARDKHVDRGSRFLPVDLAAPLLPGTFEHAAHHLLAHAVDLSRSDARFRAPHFTTVAHRVGTLGPDIAHVSAAVLAACSRRGE